VIKSPGRAIPDAGERARAFEKMVAEAYERGKAIATATLFEIDDVIDPAQTRTWVTAGLCAVPDKTGQRASGAKWVDAW
jgi:acetyl-CoA carboxylase carboxyltransferase component